jgi:hypothetical protein
MVYNPVITEDDDIPGLAAIAFNVVVELTSNGPM